MEGHLIISSGVRGRYAIEDDSGWEGGDITSGQCLEVRAGSQWISGCVEYDHDPLYVTLGPQSLEDVARMKTRPAAIGGYYVAIEGGGIMGLCVGMAVRLR